MYIEYKYSMSDAWKKVHAQEVAQAKEFNESTAKAFSKYVYVCANTEWWG